MVDLLQQGSAWLQGQREEHLSHEVTYRRGSQSVVLNATVGKSEFEQVNDHGITLQSQSRDYIIRAEDLVLGGEPVLPQAGDRIEELQGSLLNTYEVMSPGGLPPYQWADPAHLSLRIHTKWTGAES